MVCFQLCVRTNLQNRLTTKENKSLRLPPLILIVQYYYYYIYDKMVSGSPWTDRTITIGYELANNYLN